METIQEAQRWLHDTLGHGWAALVENVVFALLYLGPVFTVFWLECRRQDRWYAEEMRKLRERYKR